MNSLSPGSSNPSAGIFTPGQAFHQQVPAGTPRARTPSLPSATSQEPQRATKAQWKKADFYINQLPLIVLMNSIREISEEPTVTGTEQFS